jgi:hypothetical protein
MYPQNFGEDPFAAEGFPIRPYVPDTLQAEFPMEGAVCACAEPFIEDIEYLE